MNEQTKAIIDRARAVSATIRDTVAASSMLVRNNPQMRATAERALENAACVDAVCDALKSAERRAEEAEVRDAHNRAEVERVDGGSPRCAACGGNGAVIVDGVTVAHALTVAEVQRESYDTARAKGWHDEDETPPAPIRVIAWMGLICSEAAEAIEDARNGHMSTTIREDGKPDGLGSELADIVIRVCDSAGALGIDMEAELRAKLAFNRTRSHKHGGKLA